MKPELISLGFFGTRQSNNGFKMLQFFMDERLFGMELCQASIDKHYSRDKIKCHCWADTE